jgi:hypothetical protein
LKKEKKMESEIEIGMDCSSGNPGILRHPFKREQEPWIPPIVFGAGEDSRLCSSFCTGCKQGNLDIRKTIHEGCGVIILIHYPVIWDWKRPMESIRSVVQAKERIDDEIKRLSTDEKYLNEIRERYQGFERQAKEKPNAKN